MEKWLFWKQLLAMSKEHDMLMKQEVKIKNGSLIVKNDREVEWSDREFYV